MNKVAHPSVPAQEVNRTALLDAALAGEREWLRRYYGERVDGFIGSGYVAHDHFGTWLMYRLCDPKDMRKGKLAHRFCCRTSGPVCKLPDSDHPFGECIECTKALVAS